MKWIDIKDVVPAKKTKVLLCASTEKGCFYEVGTLGGKENSACIVIDVEHGYRKYADATHWCKLISPFTITTFLR